MRVKRLRSFYATKMREMGLLSEQIDLVQGRVGKSIFEIKIHNSQMIY